jgi:predicted MFS family arabinose efflux permease
LIVFFPIFPIFVITLILTTLGKYVFDPSIQAYIGDHVPYQQRGQIVALTEISWSMSFIIGIPLVGFLIAKFGWLSPFPLLLFLGLLSFGILMRMIPPDHNREEINSTLLKNVKLVFASAPALCILAVGLLISCANELVNLVFGLWMEDSFGLQIAALGAASAVIGLSELGGEGLSATITDRVGKKRSVLGGMLANCIAAMLLPLLGHISVWGALVGLFLFYISFEFTLVSSIPIMTEILPGARATLMAMNIAFISVGRAIGSTISPHLYGWGIIANAVTCIILNVAAIIILRSVKID